MPRSDGIVNCIRVKSTKDADFCFFQITESSGTTEYFALWWAAIETETPDATQRWLWTHEFALLRESMTSKAIPVHVFHDLGVGVDSIQLGTGPGVGDL